MPTPEQREARRVIEAAAETARTRIADDADKAAIDMELFVNAVTTRLTFVLDGFKEEQANRDKRRRRWLIIIGTIAIAVTLLLATAVSFVHTQGQQTQWDRKHGDHVSCVARADGRSASKTVSLVLSNKILDDLVSFGAATHTPDEQKAIVGFVTDEKASNAKLVNSLLPDVNCDKEAPAPSGARPTWPF